MKKFFVAVVTVFVVSCNFGCMLEGARQYELQQGVIDETKHTIEAAQNSAQKKFSRDGLIVYSEPEKYSYENFLHDMQILCENYPTQVQSVKLCDTPDGRAVYDIILGDPNGANQILIFGAMHAREYITAQVVMRQLCETLAALNGEKFSYRGVDAAEIFSGVTIHFVPNSNPDGVAISQFGLNAINNPTIRQQVAMIGGDLVQWKANARGVDLNRNFDAGWQEFRGSAYPSAERFKGDYPGSEPEAAALIRLTQDYHIKRAISYHTVGALIYWYYKQSGIALEESEKFAQEISRTTGYPLDDNYTAVDAAGYKDWAVYKLGVPAITIECGAESGYYDNPVPQRYFSGIWQRNRDVVLATAYNLKFGG